MARHTLSPYRLRNARSMDRLVEKDLTRPQFSCQFYIRAAASGEYHWCQWNSWAGGCARPGATSLDWPGSVQQFLGLPYASPRYGKPTNQGCPTQIHHIACSLGETRLTDTP